MAIKKQEFYEGAAIHLLARTGRVAAIRYEAPFFILNDELVIHLKYSTRSRSPWGFTFMPAEHAMMSDRSTEFKIVLGLICGADGVASLAYDEYQEIARPRQTSIHVACRRLHGAHYEITGPDGSLGRKVAPSQWQRILEH